ncbi:MAG: radical SAM protein [Planctomycetota bacterium]|nr:radical SAM protein [Planctomycetota bacterium]
MLKSVKRFIADHMPVWLRGRLLNSRKYGGQVYIYPTLECTLHCPYCVNLHPDGGKHLKDFTLLSPEKWIEILNRINRPVVITGGEPFLYKGLEKIVNGLNPELPVSIYTNLTLDVSKFLASTKKENLSFYCSYHSGAGSPEKFLENLIMLRDAGVNFYTHGIYASSQKEEVSEAKRFFRRHGFRFNLDVDQRKLYKCASKKFRKKVRCTKRMILIAPDGRRYQCVSKAVRMKDPLEDLTKEDLKDETVTSICNDYGYCAPCDALGETKMVLLE